MTKQEERIEAACEWLLLRTGQPWYHWERDGEPNLLVRWDSMEWRVPFPQSLDSMAMLLRECSREERDAIVDTVYEWAWGRDEDWFLTSKPADLFCAFCAAVLEASSE
jgi:hypothetical protein